MEKRPISPKSLANLKPFGKGEGGRPKGARNKLSEDFAAALHADFQEHGVEAIQRMREEEPAQYVRTIASLLPKEVKLETQPLNELSDDELSSLIHAVREADAVSAEPRKRVAAPSGSETTH